MDYAVGSIADLISGKNTENKQKLVQSEYVAKIRKDKVGNVKCKRPGTGNSSVERLKTVKAQKSSDKTIPKKRKREEAEENEAPRAPKRKRKKLSNKESGDKRIKKKENDEKEEGVKDRTIFVGNIPLSVPKGKLKKYFMKFGQVQSVRLRGVPVADVRVPKKVSYIKKQFHPDRSSLFGYVRFSKPVEAQNALQVNGQLYKGHHLKVVMSGHKEKADDNKAIFIGNVAFDAEEEELWQLFEPCGKISSVRLVRDNATGIGKGFGYVNFENADSVELALQMERPTLKSRELRVSACKSNAGKKKHGGSLFMSKLKNYARQKLGADDEDDSTSLNGPEPITNSRSVSKKTATLTQRKKKPKKQSEKKFTTKKAQEFQGYKFTEKKKKKKVSKDAAKKKQLIKKFSPKPAVQS